MANFAQRNRRQRSVKPCVVASPTQSVGAFGPSAQGAKPQKTVIGGSKTVVAGKKTVIGRNNKAVLGGKRTVIGNAKAVIAK